jgi:Lipocalin-like domain
MKLLTLAAFVMLTFQGCDINQEKDKAAVPANPMIGTWELVSGTTIQGKDTTTTDYTKTKKFLKVINSTHFSFVGHDLSKGKDSAAFYTSGAGTYTLSDSMYIEHLQFCSDRAWEGNDFVFTVVFQNDMLTQTGIEKIDSIKVNRLNIERYVRVK